MESLLSRITITPGTRSGQPCIRDLRITVWDILRWLGTIILQRRLDENLSHRLLEAIRDLFPGSVHVTQAGLSKATPDRKIWDYALQNSFIILTADTDFISIANALGPPPKVILLENCDYPTQIAAKVSRSSASQIAKFETNEERLLVHRKP